MSVALPTPTQLRAVAEQCGLSLTEEDVASFRGLMQGSIDAYNLVAAMPDEVPEVKYPRTPGYRPSPEENPRNAWYRKSIVKGASLGQAQGQDGRAEGQHHAGRRADDERVGDAGRLRARFRRHHRHADARCGRRDSRQGALRILLHVRRQPYRRGRGPCTIRTRWAIRPAARPRAAASSSRSAKPTWRSVATRAVRSACRRRSAASTA